MAADNFNACLAVTLRWEGGWSNNPKDPGGPTQQGITLKTYSLWKRRPVTVSELRNIPVGDRDAIYHQLYWIPIGCDALPKGVDMMLMDIAVNSGDGRAHVWAMQTDNMAPLTRIDELDALRCGFWKRLASYVTFGVGWLRRENAVHAAAVAMAKTA